MPIELLDGQEKPYDSLTAWKRGSYWNLVMPYVLASGLFPPGSREADGVFRYMLNHGSRFLGLVRFSPHTGVKNPGYQAPGSDDVYGTGVARFLADNDLPDQLDLSLYGKLGAGMTPETFVAGEGSTIAPAPGEYYRFMHRPPNSGNNAFFLEALRLTLVNETTDANDVPRGLELAFRDAARVAALRADRREPGADELRAALVLDRRRRHVRARERRPAEGLQRPAAAAAAAPCRPAPRRSYGQRKADDALRRPGDDRPDRRDRPRRRRRAPAALDAESHDLARLADRLQLRR